MERRRRFFVGALTAAITFGSLLAFVNPNRFDNMRQEGFAHHGTHCSHSNTMCSQKQSSENPANSTTIDSLNH